jgi:hypothetical protein
MFRSNWTILKELMLSFVKAAILWSWSVKIHRYLICGGVATNISGCDVCTACRTLLVPNAPNGRSQRSRDLRRRSAAGRLLRLRFRIPPEAWIFVCCESCVLPGRDLCDEPITGPEDSYRLWCDLETSWVRRPWPIWACCAARKEKHLMTCMTHPLHQTLHLWLTGLF